MDRDDRGEHDEPSQRRDPDARESAHMGSAWKSRMLAAMKRRAQAKTAVRKRAQDRVKSRRKRKG